MYRKLTILALILALGSTLSVLGCPNGQVLSPEGCINDCSSPQYDRCDGLSFIQIYDPKFCAWTKSKQWRSYTFACQACQSPDVIGYKDGECTGEESTNDNFSRPPQRRPFPINRSPRFIFRRTVPQRCQYRPDEIQCPVLNYLVAPNLDVCGITQAGELVGYDRSCAACQDEDVVGYWNLSCQQVKVQNTKAVSRYQRRNNRTCSTDENCRFNWQICIQGQCGDRCAVMRCRGQCRRGRCLPINRN